MLNQKLQLKLQQKLTPQQILLMKLIQLPTMALERRIKQEVEENPALEDETVSDENLQDEQAEQHDEQNEKSDDEFSLEDYLPDDETPDYQLRTNNRSKDDERKEIPFSAGKTFYDLLNDQLLMQSLSPKEMEIALHLLGSIDEAGYLVRDLESVVDDLAFGQGIDTTVEVVEKILKVIQDFEPAGVGARNLQECLQIQLHKREETELVKVACSLIGKQFDNFTHKRYERIMKSMQIDDLTLKQAIDIVLQLNPKPGNSLNESKGMNQTIIPDFIITNDDSELELTVNSWSIPHLNVNKTYANMVEHLHKTKIKTTKDKEAIIFVKQKIDAAKWFIEAIKQRQNTLFITMTAIMNYQFEYFQTGDETKLKPMILKNISDIIEMDISTVSRVANSKYVQTPFGTFLLKKLFSEAMEKDGEEVSAIEVKRILQDIIEKEDKLKPFSDERITKELNGKGYAIARRTVAKYREQLNIPVARLRKEL